MRAWIVRPVTVGNKDDRVIPRSCRRSAHGLVATLRKVVVCVDVLLELNRLTSVVPYTRAFPHSADLKRLGEANDWCVLVYVSPRLQFPRYIVLTPLRPDRLVISNSKRQLLIAKLTVPLEENVLDSMPTKGNKRSTKPLVTAAGLGTVHFFATEAGCRGFLASSLSSFFKFHRN